ncbi:MAG TPA: glycosyltransferase family 4 protein [Flavipsychrobacter sp.]|nr:glycosyltransferase family 4 protein [Flavipsychrobacter sp.]
MNILIIDNSNSFTGAFKCALNEALLLSGQYRFFFLIPSKSTNGDLLREQGFTVYQLPMKEISKSVKSITQYPFYLWSNISKLKRIVRQEAIDLVQVNDFYNLLGAGLKMTGSKVNLVTYVRFLPSSLPGVLRKLWTKLAQQYSDYVIAVSNAVLDQLPPGQNTVRVYDAVSFKEQLPYQAYADPVKTFLFLGNYTRGKGQEHAVQAFAKVYAQNKHVRLKFVGGDLGLEKNRAFRKELETMTTQLQLDAVVTFHHFDAAIERLIKSSYILLNFSEAESFSMTCLEASFYGTPVIATRCGGPEEIVDNNRTGLLVERKNIEEMTDAMSALAGDEKMRSRFSLAGRAYVREKFSEEIYQKEFTRLLQSLS